MAQIIRFPAARIVRPARYVDAIEKLVLLDEYEVSGDPVRMAVVKAVRKFWEPQLGAPGLVGSPVYDLGGEAS